MRFTAYTKLSSKIPFLGWEQTDFKQISAHQLHRPGAPYGRDFFQFGIRRNNTLNSEVFNLKEKYLRRHNQTEYNVLLDNTLLHPGIATALIGEARKSVQVGLPSFREKQWLLM